MIQKVVPGMNAPLPEPLLSFFADSLDMDKGVR